MKPVSKIWIVFSVLISVLVLIASLSGLFNPAAYSQETAEWALQAKGQDAGNLLAVAVFLLSAYSVTIKSARGYALWSGSLLYFIYAFLIYAFFVHFNFLFPVYAGVLGLSFYSLLGSLAQQNPRMLGEEYAKGKGRKTAASVLVATGSLFALLWLSEVIPALLANTSPASLAGTGLWVNPVQVIDLAVVLPALIMTGIMLFRKTATGFLWAGPWLMFSVLMGSSIVATMLMELRQGNPLAIPPLVMVTLVVLLSVLSLCAFLAKDKNK